MTHAQPFSDRLLPASRNGGLQHPDLWVWCGSVIRGDDGRYHMFASVWDRRLSFTPNWLTNSRVVRAISDTAAGPYTIAGDVLPPRGGGHWDGKMTHNPTIHRAPDGRFLLFYTGTTYEGPIPEPGDGPISDALRFEARANQRIGLAIAETPEGPWQRCDRPVLEPRPGRWDAMMTTNPAPVIHEDGSVLLAYKSTADDHDLLRYGVAWADQPDGPYRRVREQPIFDFGPNQHVEDACVWREGETYHMILKDMAGGISGVPGGGAYATSPNGLDWTVAAPPAAYTRTVCWDDGSMTEQGSLERPQVLIEHGRLTHVFFATADGPGEFVRMTRTWNMAIPVTC